ncbi:radical SAM protein [bacterium]|nr:radical SAM protein [bacterium]
MKYKPRTCVWEITFKCNVNCIHCGSDCTSVEKERQLTTAECFDIIEDLADIGCETVILSGGEPLMRQDIGAIATMIKRLGMKVGFISNGYMLNEETIKIIKAINPIAFGISIDAADGYLHDYIRGKKGTFEHVENALKLLNENGIVPSVVSTIHKLNYDQLPKIRDFLIKNKVRLWQIQYGDHIGRMPKETMLTEAQFFEIAKFILETRKKYSKEFETVSGADVFGYLGEMGTAVQGPWWGCHAGMNALGLGSDGTVRGCLSLQLDEFIEGNTHERSLKEIWNDKNSFAYNRRFDCSMLTGYCKTCTYAAVCKGGCIRAASTNGGRCNPYCLYRFEKEGFSSPEQAKTDFTKEEIFMIYNPVRPLPEEYIKGK